MIQIRELFSTGEKASSGDAEQTSRVVIIIDDDDVMSN
jgi:hypothetical protein